MLTCGLGQVVQQCVATEGVDPQYIKTDILGPFFANFWVRRMALDRRNYRALVDTTVSLASKVRLLVCQGCTPAATLPG